MSENVARTLCEKEQRQSLSGSKNVKGLKKNVRNVLAKPYGDFWPLAGPQSELELVTLLESLLPAARKPISQNDRLRLRKMQGSKMKEERDKLTKEIWLRNPSSKQLRNCLALGINDVSRGLEGNELASIMISNEADPPLLTRHLATLAATRNVPYIVIQNMKTITKKCLDFQTLALGFKKIAFEVEGNLFHPIHLKIEDVFRTIAKESVSTIPLPNCTPSSIQEVPEIEEWRSPHEIYLMRSSRKYRAFIPGKGLQTESDKPWSQFIPISSENNDVQCTHAKAPQEVLGSKTVTDTRSFLHKVRDAKRDIFQPISQAMDTGTFLSLAADSEADNNKDEADEEQSSQRKSVKRYFSSLAPLKVKRIQGNPMKVKKKQKQKQKQK